ncbi:RNA polymerase sigma factor [Sunxiuqinia rutila]|uniref:RNA polymerase sigma factor n=1 Tax=Sunxiuqinia rutila TaxID=1397841 RepID=UPI003D3666B9
MKTFIRDIDSELLLSLQKGDHSAFEKLFLKYGQKLFVFAVSYLKQESEAEEIVQEVFMKVWKNRERLKTDTSFQSYLFTIAYNSIKKSFNRKAQVDQFKEELIDQLDSGRDPIDFENNYQLVIQRLDQFIAEMPERRKNVFVQRKKHGKSLVEIANELGISVKTVENQITEAMKYLKRRFAEDFPGDLLFFSLFLRSRIHKL